MSQAPLSYTSTTALAQQLHKLVKDGLRFHSSLTELGRTWLESINCMAYIVVHIPTQAVRGIQRAAKKGTKKVSKGPALGPFAQEKQGTGCAKAFGPAQALQGTYVQCRLRAFPSLRELLGPSCSLDFMREAFMHTHIHTCTHAHIHIHIHIQTHGSHPSASRQRMRKP